jgi:lipoprotein-anchoring transpeptidase ErfK/SrfK
MRQFLLGVFVVLALFWGYSAFAKADPQQERRAPQDFGNRLDDAGTVPSRGEPAPAAAPGNSPSLAVQGQDPPLDARVQGAPANEVEDSVISAVAAGDREALSKAWRALAVPATAPAMRNRLAEALQASFGSSEDPETMLAGLGTNNEFLHSAEGRARVKALQEALVPLSDEKALPTSTRLLEACMRGAIAKDQIDAHAAVDAIYAAHKVRVDRWLCDPANVASSRSHVVAKGDSLQKIAAKFRREKILVDAGTLAVLNRIHNVNALQVGQKIKVPADPVHAVVEKRSFLMGVYVGDQILRLYWVGHGADSKTPVAEFTVSDKLERPDWYAPDGRVIAFGNPENILGDYFIKFANPSYTGFGAHGTPMPETIGTMSSMGCIRMYAPDIAELFRLLPRGAKVEIRDSH